MLYELKSLIEALDTDKDGHIATEEFLNQENDKKTNRTIMYENYKFDFKLTLAIHFSIGFLLLQHFFGNIFYF